MKLKRMLIKLFIGILVGYGVSAFVFTRQHLTSGLLNQGGLTTTYLAISDIPINRMLASVYAPAIRLFAGKAEIVWE